MDQQVHNIRACKECPGYCCNVMFLPSSKAQMQEDLLRNQGRLKELLGDLPEKPEDITEELADKIATTAMSVADGSFAKQHLVPLGDLQSKNGNSLTWYGRYAYRCDLFDQETGTCKNYVKRPWMCYSFMCEAASEGRVPGIEDFSSSAQFTPAEAAAVLSRRRAAQGKDEEVNLLLRKEDE